MNIENDFTAGVFLIDKPAGITSFGVVARVRRVLGMKKVGHAGTLDPFATGLLVVCAGRPATKLISSFMDGEKEYYATLQLGVQTETGDTEGDEIYREPVGTVSESQINECLQSFLGEQKQVPPIYSALKHEGKPLYYYARKGIAITKEARDITIHELERVCSGELVGDFPELKIRVKCSKGTYIRTLAEDIGAALGTRAYLTALRRTASGCFNVSDALTEEDMSSEDAKERFMSKVLSVENVVKLLQ
ncbi:MAG: tRNA pseudouridine(55) synthase TruB [Desulfotalea sp.]